MALQNVVVCVSASSGVQGACPAGEVETVIQAYLFESADAASALPSVDDVAAIWSVGFSLVIVCYLVGRGVGACVELIRKG
jgi:hypothetical protein